MDINLNAVERDLILVALYEYVYVSGRHDPQAYVDKRYPLSEGYDEDFRKKKLESVKGNVEKALALREKIFRS